MSDPHHSESMAAGGWSRRDFLRWSATGALALGCPGWLRAGDPPFAGGSLNFRHSTVLIELRGGNDGLNMVIPYADAAYQRARPSLAIAGADCVRMNAQLGLHRALAPLEAGFTAKDTAVILGVGYPEPNRSHFKGIDIWHGAINPNEPILEGWATRLLTRVQARGLADLLADGVVFGYSNTVGHQGLGPLYGDGVRILVMDSPTEYLERARTVSLNAADGVTPGSPLAHLVATQNDVVATAERLAELERSAPAFTTKFPDTRLGRHLQTTARLIAANADVPVWKLTLDGFDTHANQKDRHAELLAELGGGLAAFRAAMIEASRWDQVGVMTYSEFGRRVEENASFGTDHGTAAPMFVLGGKVHGGLHGAQPRLDRLDNGDLVHTVDFRSVYRSVAAEWMGYQGDFISNKKIKSLPGLFQT